MKTQIQSRRHAGFTIVDLIVLIFFLAIFAALLLPANSGGGSRKAAAASTCRNNVKTLGLAIYMYASDNMDKLPPAGVKGRGVRQMSFDSFMSAYLGDPADRDLRTQVRSERQYRDKTLQCPEDTVIDRKPTPGGREPAIRSYAMPRFFPEASYASAGSYGVTSESQTGVGIWLEVEDPHQPPLGWERFDADHWDPDIRNWKLRTMPSVRSHQILDPVGTIMMTEHHADDNRVGDMRSAWIGTADWTAGGRTHVRGQRSIHPKMGISYYLNTHMHEGRPAYLFADGHVESLPREATTSDMTRQMGHWSIKPDDWDE